MARKNTQTIDVPAKQVYTLSTGTKFSVLPVSNILLYGAQQKAKFPDVPLVKIRQGGKDIWTENPSQPDYVRRVQQTESQRNMLAMEAMILHGIKMESPLPESDQWLKKIRRTIDLTDFEDDEGDIAQEDKEYLYLRYVAISSDEDYTAIARAVVPTEQEVGEEGEIFPGDETRPTD